MQSVSVENYSTGDVRVDACTTRAGRGLYIHCNSAHVAQCDECDVLCIQAVTLPYDKLLIHAVKAMHTIVLATLRWACVSLVLEAISVFAASETCCGELDSDGCSQ
eukprot:1700-Heterococcus_DN1.PRE.2